MYLKSAAEMEWRTPPIGYYLSDAKEKLLWLDPKSGASVVLMKWPPGVLDKKHRHPHANQWDFILSGKIKEGDRPVEDVSNVLGFLPKGEVHGGTLVVEECLVLFHWDGPREPEVIE
jgi:2,4'-dihydroxyacetophenone dioxygenase